MSDDQPAEADLMTMDDPDFLDARKRVREELEELPAHHTQRGRLTALYAAMNDEFIRRASIAWDQPR